MFAAMNGSFNAEQPVEFDAGASGGNPTVTSNSISTSWTHTPTSTFVNGRVAIVVISVLQQQANYSQHARTVTYGGQAMFSAGGVHAGGFDSRGWIEIFYLVDPPMGAQTVSVTVSLSGTSYKRLSGCSLTYSNCSVVGNAVFSSGTGGGTGLSQTVNSVAADMVIGVLMDYSALQSGSISSFNQTQRFSLPAAGGNKDEAVVVGDAIGVDPSVTFTATRVTSNDNYGCIGLRLSPVFIPYSEVNINRTNMPIPKGATQYRVALLGAGGGGGNGYIGSGARGAGAGGGGGAVVYHTSWMPVSELGSTYSVVCPPSASNNSNGGNASFTSGSVSLVAGGGSAGGAASGSGGTTGGTGGSATISGTTASSENGGSGGNGGDGSSSKNGTAGASTTLSGAGGGGGGGMASFNVGTQGAGATGGSTSGATGGAAGPNTSGVDGTGSNGGSPSGGVGGGGGGGASTRPGWNNGFSGGTGGNDGAGGGGGCGAAGGSSPGGTSGQGFTRIDFI